MRHCISEKILTTGNLVSIGSDLGRTVIAQGIDVALVVVNAFR